MLSAHFNFDDIAGEFFRMLVFALVWGSYVLRSQNKREVFVRKYNERACGSGEGSKLERFGRDKLKESAKIFRAFLLTCVSILDFVLLLVKLKFRKKELANIHLYWF